MLLEFKARNYRSFKNEMVFSINISYIKADDTIVSAKEINK